MERRVGLQADRLDGRIVFLQPPRRAHECARRAQPGHKVRHLPGRLLPESPGPVVW